jgi:hypothetical protein
VFPSENERRGLKGEKWLLLRGVSVGLATLQPGEEEKKGKDGGPQVDWSVKRKGKYLCGVVRKDHFAAEKKCQILDIFLGISRFSGYRYIFVVERILSMRRLSTFRKSPRWDLTRNFN